MPSRRPQVQYALPVQTWHTLKPSGTKMKSPARHAAQPPELYLLLRLLPAHSPAARAAAPPPAQTARSGAGGLLPGSETKLCCRFSRAINSL